MKLKLIAASFLIAVSAYGQGSQTPIYNGLLQSDLNADGFKILTANLADYAGTNLTWNIVTNQFDATGGGGTLSLTADFPAIVTPDPITGTGVVSIDFLTTANWDSAYTEKRYWDGGSNTLNAATGRTSLGLVIGTNVEAWLGNPSVNGYVLSSTTAGVRSWIAPAVGGGTPGGSDTQVQYNDGGVFGGDAGLTYNKTTDVLTLADAGYIKWGTSPAIREVDANALEINNGVAGNYRDLHLRSGVFTGGTVQVEGAGYFLGGVGASEITLTDSGGLGVNLASTYGIVWSSTALWSGARDTGLFRNAAGVLEINNNTMGVYRDLIARNITSSGGAITGSGSVPTGGASGEVLKKSSATNYDYAWAADSTGAGGGAPTTVDYLVGTADGGLSAEIVVGTSPGGELGGTWASPTLDDSVTVASWTLTTPTIAAISNLTGNGFVKTSGGVGTLSIDTSTYLTSSSISDTAYAGTWDTVTTIAPSKNAVYDKIETLQPLDGDLTELAAISPVQGDVIYHNGTDWVKLATGTNGNQLTTHGAGANPTWDAPGTGGGSGDVVGPASSVASEIVLFDLTTGKLIKSATGSGLVTATSGVYGTTTNNTSSWDTAATDALKWNGGATGLTAATGRTSLGLDIGVNVQAYDADLTTYAGVTPTTVGLNFIDLANPTAIRFPKITAGNDVVAEDAATFRTSIGAGTSSFDGTFASLTGTISTTQGAPLISDTAFAGTWNAVTTIAPSKNAVYDYMLLSDTDADGKINVLDLTAGLVETDGSGVVATATAGTDYVSPTGTETLTNKRVNPRVTTITSNATLSPNGDTTDIYAVSALATAITTISAPTGTPVDGQKLIIRIISDSSVRAISGWNAIYRFSSTLPAPSTTVASTTHTIGFMYNSTAVTWDCLAQTANP